MHQGGRMNAETGLAIDCDRVIEKVEDFIRERMAAAGKSCAVVGLSGGVDSSVTAYLCARALGRENVLGVILPCRVSSPESSMHAEQVVAELGIESETIDISGAVDACTGLCSGPDRVRKGNLIARLRMVVLYDRAHLRNGLVVGTTNRTELLLGYLTKYGDGGVDIEPLAGLYKTQVWQLAVHLGVPEDIIRKAPTADLWAGQTDEGELGFSYREVDKLLHVMYDEGVPREDLPARGFDPEFVEAVAGIIASSAHKREPAPVAEL